MQHWERKWKLSRQCGGLCINMKEKFNLLSRLFTYSFLLPPNLLIYFMALNAILNKIIRVFTWILSFLVGTCEKIVHKSVKFYWIASKIWSANMFDSMNRCVKLQASAISRFCCGGMTGRCTQKTIFWSCDIDKDQR